MIKPINDSSSYLYLSFSIKNYPSIRIMKYASFLLLALLFQLYTIAQSYPEGFTEEVVFNSFERPAGILHTESEISVAWELTGKIWVITGEDISSEPVIDISDEAANWGEHGLIGVALDPSFLENGLIYLFYTAVDFLQRKNITGFKGNQFNHLRCTGLTVNDNLNMVD